MDKSTTQYVAFDGSIKHRIGLVVTIRRGEKTSTRILITSTDNVDEAEARIRNKFSADVVETYHAPMHFVEDYLVYHLDNDLK